MLFARAHLRGRKLEYLTIGWNSLEAIIAIAKLEPAGITRTHGHSTRYWKHVDGSTP
jgi:hypothetical protein